MELLHATTGFLIVLIYLLILEVQQSFSTSADTLTIPISTLTLGLLPRRSKCPFIGSTTRRRLTLVLVFVYVSFGVVELGILIVLLSPV